jgi:AraC family transcriptional regulator of adaptative response/methylated-DNA-[protein]-cysteine methyltransferase
MPHTKVCAQKVDRCRLALCFTIIAGVMIVEGNQVTAAMKAKSPDLQLTEEACWRAVMSRDAQCDGQFVFAVSSTGIYCRPSCPSRRPRRDRVAFFSVPQAAEQAGFRACLRCRPNQLRLTDPQVELVKRVCSYLQTDSSDATKLTHLAQQFGVSPFHLQRIFKSVMGITPRQYVAAHRFGSFKARVRAGDTVTNAMYDSGFNSSSRLYENAADELGMTPATYSRGGRGANISYTIVDSILGRLMVAVTERGICSVRMGDSDVELERQLDAEFPEASITRADGLLSDVVAEVLDRLSDRQPADTLPLDVRATAFQRQVWEHLKGIPYGETRSYSEVAQALGKPGAVRAIGRACATNPVAVVIPCHRVVREDHSLGGYRWGLERKQQLLQLERLKKKR